MVVVAGGTYGLEVCQTLCRIRRRQSLKHGRCESNPFHSLAEQLLT